MNKELKISVTNSLKKIQEDFHTKDNHYSILLLARAIYRRFLEEKNLTEENLRILTPYKQETELILPPSSYAQEIKGDLSEVSGWIFEAFMDQDTSKVTGSHYTPDYLTNDIVDKALELYSQYSPIDDGIKVCDPCCGASGMLIPAIKKLSRILCKSYQEVINQNIFGLDINEEAVQLSKIRLAMLCLDVNNPLPDPNIQTSNLFHHTNKYDIIVGNPPYLSNKATKAIPEVQDYLKEIKKPPSDLYIAATYKSHELLNPNGSLAYLTPNTYYTDINKKHFRDFLTQQRGLEIINVGGGVFERATVNVAIVSFVK